MHNLRYCLFLIVVLASCGGETSTTTAIPDTTPDTLVATDTLTQDSVALETLAFTLGGDTIVPEDKSRIFFSFDAKLMNKKSKPLTAKETKRRFMPIDPECDGEAMYKLQRFFYLDSLKKIGEEPEHDIGQLASVTVDFLDTIRKDENGCWVIWRIDYSTIEACPYASGTLFMLTTYDKSGKQVSTQCMCRDEGGADPPISWTCHEYSNIFTDGSFRSLYADSTEDYDENDKPVYSVMRKTFTGQISAAGKITRTESEIERTE